jgi:hypothetical protein
MPFYVRLGDIPRKRHIVFRDNGLYHLQSPCRVNELGEFEPIEHVEWLPEAHARRQ